MGDVFTSALLVSADVTLAAALVWLSLPRERRRRWLAVVAAIPLGMILGLTVQLSAAARAMSPGDLALPLMRLRALHALALLGGAFLLRQRVPRAGARLGDARIGARAVRLPGIVEAVALAGALAAFFPEGMALAAVLRESADLAGSARGTALVALAAAASAALAGSLAVHLAGRLRGSWRLPASAVLALLFALRLAGAGAAGARLAPLGMGLTASVGRIIHDAVHMLFVLAQLPDHPYLRDEVYQAILLLLEPWVHAAAAAGVLAAPLAAAWWSFARRPQPPEAAGTRAPGGRLLRAASRRQTRIGGAAFAASLALTGAAILSAQARGQGQELYDPLPEPAVDDGAGTVVVPLTGPLGGGGRMRKYAWRTADRTVTFFTIPRLDGSLAVALDLCEICQPRGYAQMGRGYVFCKYCKTPIPVDTVGRPGGCNPIPLPSARVEGGLLRISAAEMRALLDRAGERSR